MYGPKPEAIFSRVSASTSSRFPNLEVIGTDNEEAVYFDSRLDESTGLRWASPVQSYLELMAGDKRDQETAAQVRAEILKGVGG